MTGRWRRHRTHAPAEMNITAFMNLMVILVPFLLITAVFSHLAILELDLPTGDSASSPPPLALELTIRKDRLELSDHGRALEIIQNTNGKHDLKRLVKTLTRIKSLRPNERAISLLVEERTTYQTLIHIMDKVKETKTISAGNVVNAALFPDISIGDAGARDPGNLQ